VDIKRVHLLQVMSIMGVQGKHVGKVVEQITDWQLANPRACAQECEEWLQANKGLVMTRADAALESEGK